MASVAPSSALTAAALHCQDLNPSFSSNSAVSLSFKLRFFCNSTKIFSLYPLVLQCSRASANNGRISKSLVVAALPNPS
ncbi:PHD finger family protein [Perilla frutescens var. hirtella]|uniref:PHD finger family protein n=1 Tax=Perilla frutescens var. hirtella TaxID=608512 RepID=A0AAD4P9Y2_PERFH|nr:PHD finger family protein [Perilla frutescens var. hirtella]